MKPSRRETNRQERQAAIIAVAREHFFEQGYAATSMSAIAQQLGGSKGTLWNYFSSKEDLFAAVIDDTATAFRDRIDFPPPGGDILATLTRLCRSLIDQAVSPAAQAMIRLINAEGARFPHIGRIFFEHGPYKTQKLVADYLAEHLAGELRDADFVTAGRALFALSTSGIFYEYLWGISGVPSAEEKDSDARRASAIFFLAYGRDPKGAGDALEANDRAAAARTG